jgi:hypothetical protein
MGKRVWLLIALGMIAVLVIVIISLAGFLTPSTRDAELVFPTGLLTITDDLGDSPYPELDIVEATVEGNETNLIMTIKVNGEVPNQTDPSKGPKWAEGKIGYSFGDVVVLDLEGNEWIPKLGHLGYRLFWFVECVGEEFPGTFAINQEAGTIQVILDLNLLKEKDIPTADHACAAKRLGSGFIWCASSGYVMGRGLGYYLFGSVCDETDLVRFPG